MHPVLVTAIAATQRQDQLARTAAVRLARQARQAEPAPGCSAPDLRARRRAGLAALHLTRHQKAGA